jgi:hypothetical protein
MNMLQVIGVLLCVFGLWQFCESNSRRIKAIERRLTPTNQQAEE